MRVTGARPSAWVVRPFSVVQFDLLPLISETFDTQFDDIASLEVAGRLHAHADAGRRAGRYDIAGLQGHELAQIGDEICRPVNHCSCRAVLHRFAVDLEPYRQVLRARHLVFGDQPRSYWAKRVAAF